MDYQPDWILSLVDASKHETFGLRVEGRNLSDGGRPFTWFVDARRVLDEPRYTYPASCVVTDAAQAVIDRAGEWLHREGKP